MTVYVYNTDIRHPLTGNYPEYDFEPTAFTTQEILASLTSGVVLDESLSPFFHASLPDFAKVDDIVSQVEIRESLETGDTLIGVSLREIELLDSLIDDETKHLFTEYDILTYIVLVVTDPGM